MTVIRDCTGIYLRFFNKDYPVCNTDMLEDYPDGSKVTASFKKINACDNKNQIQYVCAMVHYGKIGAWVEVVNLNNYNVKNLKTTFY